MKILKSHNERTQTNFKCLIIAYLGKLGFSYKIIQVFFIYFLFYFLFFSFFFSFTHGTQIWSLLANFAYDQMKIENEFKSNIFGHETLKTINLLV